MTTKNCSRCKADVPLEKFGNDSRASDGKQPRCNPCCSAAQRERYAANPNHYRERQRTYNIEKKEIVKAINKAGRARNAEKIKLIKKAEYEKNKQDPSWKEKQKQYRLATRARKQAYDAVYKLENRAEVSKRSRRWALNNPRKRASISKAYSARRRSIEKGGDTTRDIHAWEAAARKVCYWCGVNCKDAYHVDHYEPLSKGGRHEISNLVIACPPCNLTKNAKDPYVFAQQVGRLF